MSYRLGIDLGASSLVAGVRRAAGRPELLTFATGRPYVVVDDVRDTAASAEQSTADLLRLVRERAEAALGEPPDEVV
ncbi:MAG: hypothetical protein KDB51_18365, partial [Propionibacteriaceae bacterium]|nr:hypothetical protein [Propionibacteriaceae bacterium]